MQGVIFTLLFWCTACGGPIYTLYIDDACTPEHTALIREGIARANDWTCENTGDAVIQYGGRARVDHARAADASTDPYNDGKDTVVCFYNEPPQWADLKKWHGDGIVGFSAVNGGDIWLFLFRLETPARVAGVVSHELGHYIGIRPHAPPGAWAAMADPIEWVINYTVADTELLCDVFHCF